MTPDSLEALLARVEAGSGPDREVDVAVMTAIGGWRQIDEMLFYGPREAVAFLEGDGERYELPHPTTSTDVVLALIGELLPGWKGDLDIGASWGDGLYGCRLFPPDKVTNLAGEAKSPTRAALSALLRALIARRRAEEASK